jgi:Flp pilus assembly protein TadD
VFFIFLAPLSNLFVPMGVIGAERWLYLPSLGFCWLAGELIGAQAARPGRSRLALGAAACLLAYYGVRTLQNSRIWRSEASFWEACAAASPRSPLALNGRGMMLMRQDRFAEARRYFREALDLRPGLPAALYNQGLSSYLEGDLANAEAAFRQVLSKAPEDPDTLNYLGSIAERRGRWPEAESFYLMALRADPLDTFAKRNLGLLKFRRRRPAEGLGLLQAYVREAPAGEAEDVRAFLERVNSGAEK